MNKIIVRLTPFSHRHTIYTVSENKEIREDSAEIEIENLFSRLETMLAAGNVNEIIFQGAKPYADFLINNFKTKILEKNFSNPTIVNNLKVLYRAKGENI